MYPSNYINSETEKLSSMVTPPNLSLIYHPKPIRSAKPFLNQFSNSLDFLDLDSLFEKRKILSSMLDCEQNIYSENTTDIIDMILKYKIKNPDKYRYLSNEKRNLQLEAEHSIIKFMKKTN